MNTTINSAKLDKGNASIVKEIIKQVRAPEGVSTSLSFLIKDLKNYFDCDAIIIFALDQSANQLKSLPQCGFKSEINVDIAPTNLVGFVAGSGKSLNIKNVKNPDELTQYHPQLAHGSIWDGILNFKTQSLIAVPLTFNQNLIGVLTVINKRTGDSLSEVDLKLAQDISYALGLVLEKVNKELNQEKEEEPGKPTLSFDPQTEGPEDPAIHTLSEEPSLITAVKKEKFSREKPSKYGYLIKNDLITEEKLTSCLAQAKNNKVDEETILLETGGLKRKDLGLSLAEFYDLPYYGYQSTINLSRNILGGLNKNYLASNYWLPIKINDSKIVILINNPSNLHICQNIKQIYQKKEIEFKFGLKIDIIDFLNSLLEQEETRFDQFKTEKMSSLITSLQAENEEAFLESKQDDDLEDPNAITEVDSTIIRLVNKVLIDAVEKEISDVHFEPGIGKDNMLVRFRKDGDCFNYEEIPFLYKHAIISRIKIMSKLDIAERRVPQDGKIKMTYGGRDVEFRVATCPTIGGNEDAVLRLLAQSKPIPLEEMHFSKYNLELTQKLVAKPYGLILVVGPTGSGKTTTLHSCLGHINTPERKIWTAEDPVEITQKGLRQVQTLEKKGLNFARAMRSFLRGDPDVIMVGEMRDTETASIAMEASLTGHLVFSTLHTNSAPETITRLLDMGMNPLNFADALLLIIAQRLVKTLCKKCKEDYHPSKKEFDTLVKEYGKKEFQKLGIQYNADLTLKKPVGCEICADTGYHGRMAIHEILEGTQELKRMVVKQASAGDLRKMAIEEGMITLKQDGIQKVFSGDCDLRQVLSVCIL